MNRLLIIPDINNMDETLKVAQRYSLGFEYNDFFIPDNLDDEKKLDNMISSYKKYNLPEYCTLHGAFYDVIPFSPDSKIREISIMRIRQSIEVAKRIGATAVVFHTNYNPFLNTPAYMEEWIRENISFWSKILERNNDINIYLENMFDTSPYIMEKLANVLSKYKNFGICLDYAHAELSSVNPRIWAESLGRYVKHIHINDNDLISDLHLAWGDGESDREEFYYCYEKYMREASVLIETNSMENIKKTLEVLIKDGFIKN